MTFVGTSSVSSLVHICAKLPRTALTIACLGLGVFVVYHFHKEQYVKKEVMTEVGLFEKDLYHMGASNASQPVISSTKLVTTELGKKPVVKTSAVERP